MGGVVMRLIKEILIKDIFDYEIQNDVNILKELNNLSIDVVLDMFVLGNKISFDEACELLDRELENRELTEIIKQLVEELIGKVPDGNEETIKSEDIGSLSDVLSKFYNDMQVVDEKLDINTFMNMSMGFMYRYADGIKQRFIYKENKQLKDNFTYIGMFLSAFAGKLKECPQISEETRTKEEILIDKFKALNNRGGV